MTGVTVDVDRASCAERVARAARLTRAGNSARQIGWDLGVSTRAAQRYRTEARKLGLLPPAPPRGRAAAVVGEALALREAGHGWNVITRRLGVSRSGITRAVRQAGGSRSGVAA